MHEYSLVQSLLKQVSEIAAANGGGDVEWVRLEVGQFAGVEIELLQIAFQELAPKALGLPVELLVIPIPLQVKCKDCDAISEMNDFHFSCKACGSERTWIISGEEIRLIDLGLTESNRRTQEFSK